MQEPKSELLSLMKSKFPFLSETDIVEFLKIHPWLENENDPLILIDYLMEYSKGIADHFLVMHTSLSELKEEWSKELPKKDENLQQEQSNSHQKEEVFEVPPSEDDILMGIVGNFDEMKNVLKDLDALNESDKHFSLIFNVLWRILQFPENPNFRQIILDPSEYLLSTYIVEVFETLGFVKLDIDEKINLIYSENNLQFFKNITEFIELEYCPQVKQQPETNNSSQNLFNERVSAQMSAQLEKANYLAQVHENRIFSKQNNYYNKGNQNSFPNNIGPATNVATQMKEYRDRMRQKTLENSRFTGKNIMNFDKLSAQQEASFTYPQNKGFDNKFVTMKDIENKQIEENKVGFGHKALQLTNEFRKSQGLAPLQWSQELCNIGMKHSIDMAEGIVPFGHQNFQNRVQKISFHQLSVFENVAYCFNMTDTPKAIVDGWIKSQGHRKNLLSDSNVCGIAVYRNSKGYWYFTQLLAKKA